MFSLERSLVAGEKLVVTLLMALAFLAVVVMIPVRYLGLVFPDLSEVSLMTIATLTFLCIGLLVHTGGHISIEVAGLVKSKVAQFTFRQIANLGILVFVVLFGIQAFKLLQSVIGNGGTTLVLHIPLVIPFGALIVGLLLAAFHAVMNCARDLKVLRDADADFTVGDNEEVSGA